MFLDKINKNITQFRQYIVLVIFLFLILITSFFSGEWSNWLQAIIFVVVFLLILYSILLMKSTGEDPPDCLDGSQGGRGARGSGKGRFFSHPNFYLILFLIIVFATSFFSINKYNSFSLLFLLLSYAACYFSAYLFFRGWKYIKFTTIFIFVASVLASIISLVMFISQSSNRGMGLLFNANALGSYLLFGLPLGAVLAIYYKQSKFKYLYFFCFLIILVSFLLTYSYTGFVGLILPLLIFVLYFWKKIFARRNVIIFIVLLLIGFICLTIFRYQQSRNLIEAVQIYKTIPYDAFIFSFSQRLNFNQSALEIFKDYPLTGSGFNTYQNIYSRYYHTVFEQPRYTHNYYLQTAAETGIFGFLALIIFIVLLFRKVYQLVKNEKDEQKRLYFFGLSLGILGSAIHSLFDFGWQFPAVFILFWIISGMLMARWRTTDYGLQTTAGENAGKPGWLAKVGQGLAMIIALAIFVRGITLFAGAYYLQKAASTADSGDLKGSYKFYENSYKFDPDPIKLANYILERLKFPFILKTEDYKMMEDKLNKQLLINKENYYVHWTLGKVYFLQDKFEQAQNEYRQAIYYNPVFRPDIYYDLAFLQFEQKNYSQSRKTIFSILEKYPEGISSSNPNLPTQLAFLNLLLGKNYSEEGKNDLAKIYFNKALKYVPNFDLAKEELGKLK